MKITPLYKLLFTVTVLLLLPFAAGAQTLKEKEYYPNKTIMAEGEAYKNGRREGFWVLYDATGKREQEGKYAEGLRQGAWKRFNPANQVVIEDVIYDRDSADGVYKSYYDITGNPAEAGLFDHGVQVGGWETYYDTKPTTRYSKGSYTNGKKTGPWKFYYEGEGNIWEEGNYENDFREGEWTVYFDAEKRVKQAVGSYSRGRKDGAWTFYYQSPNSVMTRIKYIANLEQDTFTLYYPGGAVKEKGTYVNGEYHSLNQQFYENGNLKQEGIYIYGEKKDEWRVFYENGIKKIIGSYENNEANGLWTFYRDNGAPEYDQIFRNGKVWGKRREYYHDGNLYAEGIMHDDLKDGEWRYYDLHKHLLRIEEWREGTLVRTVAD